MDFQGYQNKECLQQYYAGQALVGLLSHGKLEKIVYADEERADELAILAYNIAGAMVRETERRFQ